MKEESILTNQELYDKIYDGIYPKKENMVTLVCAIIIASIRLNMNAQLVMTKSQKIQKLFFDMLPLSRTKK